MRRIPLFARVCRQTRSPLQTAARPPIQTLGTAPAGFLPCVRVRLASISRGVRQRNSYPTPNMRERDWVHQLVPGLRNRLRIVDPTLEVEDGQKLPYANEVLRYTTDRPKLHTTSYETDLLVFERPDAETWVPRVVVEMKMRTVTTHGAITYSQKAGAHKNVHPYVRYGILIGNRGHRSLPGRLFRHGVQFDFMLTWRKLEPSEEELDTLVSLLYAEVRASRLLEDIIYNTRGRNRAHYTVLHKPLVLS